MRAVLDKIFKRRQVSKAMPWKPTKLFTAGVNGAWYDPSDFSTMFQGAAGTTPVTAVGQPVGLMLDKSKGLVLGPELITNAADRDFSSDTGFWGKDPGVTISGGAANYSSVPAGYALYRSAFLPQGYYAVTYTVTSLSSGSVSASLGTNSAPARTSTGTFTDYVYTSSTSSVAVAARSAGTTASIDNISVKELPGNHAYNPSGNSANFPVLSARYNLQAGSQVDSGWAGQATTPPTVTNSVSYLGESCVAVTFGPLNLPGYANSRAAYSANDVITILGQRYITSFNVSLSRDLTGGESIAVYYTGANGLATAVINAANSSSFVGQWNRITTVAVTAVAGGAVRIYAYNAQTLTSDVTVYINKADLRVANDALNQPAYQRVNTATDYDTVGFKPYLSFNGVNQWLRTNSIDFTYGDKMFVCAGVRKLSDAARGIVVEATGGFNVSAPAAASPTYSVYNSGSSVGIGPIVSASIFPAPESAVLSFIGGIAAPRTALRRNSSYLIDDATSLGASNYGNYPLYIGARAGSSLWFNGRLYGLVIAGKQASASEIANTEQYLNQKTGAY